MAIVNAQEIPIGGMKVVGTFEPGGYHYETPLSKWFLEGYSAPGEVLKTGSVKFEPPGGMLKGTWLIHLENEWGERFSEDLAIATDPDNREWFFVKFKDITAQPVNTATPTPPIRRTPIPSPTPVKQNTSTPIPSPTPLTPAGGWSFANLRQRFDEDEESVIIYGNARNETGAAQEISFLTGTFYDQQGQIIATEDDTDHYLPLDVVPPGGFMPFELFVYDVDHIADFTLRVFSQPSSQRPRTGFEFSNLNPAVEDGDYCVAGSLRNPGDPLQDYLLLAVVLYNNEDQVINFGDYEVRASADLVGEALLDFEICADFYGQNVASYKLQAWGE